MCGWKTCRTSSSVRAVRIETPAADKAHQGQGITATSLADIQKNTLQVESGDRRPAGGDQAGHARAGDLSRAAATKVTKPTGEGAAAAC